MLCKLPLSTSQQHMHPQVPASSSIQSPQLVSCTTIIVHVLHNPCTLRVATSSPPVAAAGMFLLPTPAPCAGGGEFGEVYKAKWHGSYVAAKVLKRSDEIALGDFRTEIAILRKIHHPNCVQVRLAQLRPEPFCYAVPSRPCLPPSLAACGLSTSHTKRSISRMSRRHLLADTTAIQLSVTAPMPCINTYLCCCAVLQFLGACTKQKPYIVLTELMACSLADAFLKTFYAPTQRRQVEVALDFARGMAYLHSRRQPIVHRCGSRECSQLYSWGYVRSTCTQYCRPSECGEDCLGELLSGLVMCWKKSQLHCIWPGSLLS
jgi:hypothetical protein